MKKLFSDEQIISVLREARSIWLGTLLQACYFLPSPSTPSARSLAAGNTRS